MSLLGRPDTDIPFDVWRQTTKGAMWLFSRRLSITLRLMGRQLARDALRIAALARVR